jgi:hypothetical protein
LADADTTRIQRTAPQTTFRTEPLTDGLIGEITPLLREHYLEIAHYQDIELDPDWNKYFSIQANGSLKIFTARDEENRLHGYNCYFIHQNPHYRKSLQATNDVIFIRKTSRGFGREFIAWCDEQLRAMGVQVAYHHVKAAHDWTPMLERMGYDFQDKIMSRRLDL